MALVLQGIAALKPKLQFHRANYHMGIVADARVEDWGLEDWRIGGLGIEDWRFQDWGGLRSLPEEGRRELVILTMDPGEINFYRVLSQVRMIRRLARLRSICKFLMWLPGLEPWANLGGIEREAARSEAIILSMTPAEKSNPDLLDGPRKARIAAGSARRRRVAGQGLRGETLRLSRDSALGVASRMPQS